MVSIRITSAGEGFHLHVVTEGVEMARVYREYFDASPQDRLTALKLLANWICEQQLSIIDELGQ